MTPETIAAFMALVVKGPTEDHCWQWRGQEFPSGGPRFEWTNGNTPETSAKRFAMSMGMGGTVLPNDRHVWAMCNTVNCVNPDHMMLSRAGDPRYITRKHPDKVAFVAELARKIAKAEGRELPPAAVFVPKPSGNSIKAKRRAEAEPVDDGELDESELRRATPFTRIHAEWRLLPEPRPDWPTYWKEHGPAPVKPTVSKDEDV